MRCEELVELLEQIASGALEYDEDLFDHPCNIAVRAIDQAFSDIASLQRVAPKRTGSKHMQHLIGLSYDPNW